jgi:nifR3 family TIM-barrel protein
MYDATDAPFRRLIARHGKPDVMITEFVSCDGLCSRGRENLMYLLKYDETERPIVAQIFGEKPETHYQTALFMQELGFDGIDINMGCPVKTICKTGAGSAMINTPELAKEIIRETIRGAGGLPVSVKTRIGWNHISTEEWVGYLLDAGPAVITLHLRTRREMSDVGAHWDEIHKAVELARNTDTLIIGNGDVGSIEEAEQLAKETGVDGIMIGRAVFGNPWFFNRNQRREDVPLEEVFETMIEHAELYEDVFEGRRNFAVMRKHLRAYAREFDGSRELRKMLEEVNSAEDLRKILKSFNAGTALRLEASPDCPPPLPT